MNFHFIGMELENKQMGRFFGGWNDEEFNHIMNKLGGTLPKGFKVWHISEEEIERNSKRVQALKKLPYILEFNPFTITGEGYADAEKYLLRAKEREELERR